MTEIKLLSDSEIEIAGEISAGDFMFEKDPAIKEMTRNLDIKGFRKGKIPEDIILKNVNQRAILERMAVMALEKKYPEIIKKNKIKPIGRPEIIITKMVLTQLLTTILNNFLINYKQFSNSRHL